MSYGLKLSRHVDRLFNAEPDLIDIPAAWDSVTIDTRANCKGCWLAEESEEAVDIGRDQTEYLRTLKCWLIVPIDSCGVCPCKVYCGSTVTFPNKRPGEVYTVGARPIASRYSKCVQWPLTLECGPCD